MYLYAALLFFAGINFGSFVNALVWRVHEQSGTKSKSNKGSKKDDLSIVSGHSMCPYCRHRLSAADLVPILSWCLLKGRCRYCKKPISPQYPVVELVGGLVFGVSYLAWPFEFSHGQYLLLGTWLLCSVGLLALAVYDIKWQLLPNRILYPGLAVAAAGRGGYILLYAPDKMHDLIYWVLALVVASGLFYVIFMISNGKWIGFGDVRLGLLTGTLLASPKLGLLMIFSASVLGTLMVLPSLVKGGRSVNSKIPFGPYLIAGSFLSLLYGERLIDWYVVHLGV